MESWEHKLPPVLAAIRPAAMRFRKWAAMHAGEAAAADCELALVEACNNLINHNARVPGVIHLRAEASPFEIKVTIRDGTDGFDWPATPCLPAPEAETGRGIFLMHTLMTQVEYRRKAGANELRLRRRITN
jgi:anti-sigma regulatory factor (Ser/Thr protein kinase)